MQYVSKCSDDRPHTMIRISVFSFLLPLLQKFQIFIEIYNEQS